MIVAIRAPNFDGSPDHFSPAATQAKHCCARSPHELLRSRKEVMSFTDLGLDPAILKAIEFTGYTEPTSVQMQAIPAAGLR
jgi:superfamily II DNA/RNA helicase